jgi:hypothetical protein
MRTVPANVWTDGSQHTYNQSEPVEETSNEKKQEEYTPLRADESQISKQEPEHEKLDVV